MGPRERESRAPFLFSFLTLRARSLPPWAGHKVCGLNIGGLGGGPTIAGKRDRERKRERRATRNVLSHFLFLLCCGCCCALFVYGTLAHSLLKRRASRGGRRQRGGDVSKKKKKERLSLSDKGKAESKHSFRKWREAEGVCVCV